MFKPEGIYVAMLTPFDQDGSINETELRRIVDFQIEAGVHGLFPVSSVGEFIHLDREEKVRLMEIVVDQARGRVHVTAGITASHPVECIDLAKKAKKLGCSGVVLAPPYYFPLSPPMAARYFETVAAGVDLPIILYNIPLFSTPLTYGLVEHLSGLENVVGLKDSSGSMVDFLHFMDSARLAGREINCLTGREETLFPCLMVGGRGCMTATAGILPEIMIGIYQAWQAGDYDRAGKLQATILPLLRKMFAVPFPLGFKLAQAARGFDMGPPKQPLAEPEHSRLGIIRDEMEEMVTAILEQGRNLMKS